MKGQYFSFDAIVATVIMVIAATSLVSYWAGAQSVVDSRANSLHSGAMRIAESLFSPGVPSGWPDVPFSSIRQFGIADGFDNSLNQTKVLALSDYLNTHYEESQRMLRAGANITISIEQTDYSGPGMVNYTMGAPLGSASPSEVAIANRGAVLGGHPVRIRVILWR